MRLETVLAGAYGCSRLPWSFQDTSIGISDIRTRAAVVEWSPVYLKFRDVITRQHLLFAIVAVHCDFTLMNWLSEKDLNDVIAAMVGLP
jgi:hypothetical protein